MNGILPEIVPVELHPYGVEPCHMELPVRMLLLKLVMDRRTVQIFHRHKHQIQPIRKLLVDILRQQFLKQDKGSVRTGYFVGMMPCVDDLARASA